MRRVAAALLGSLAFHALVIFVVLPDLRGPAPGAPAGAPAGGDRNAIRLRLLPGAPELPPPGNGNSGAAGSQAPADKASTAAAPAAEPSTATAPADTGAELATSAAAPARAQTAADTSAAPTPTASVAHPGAGGAQHGRIGRIAREYSSEEGETVPAAAVDPIAPRYPEGARRRKEEGAVRLLLEIDAQGRITSVAVEESSGAPALDSAAAQAAGSASFRPALRDGTPVSSSVRVTVLFELEPDS